MPIALEPFDPSRDFIAKTNFRAGGVIHARHAPFDKGRVNDRVLRQLYEARKIGYPEDRTGKAAHRAHKRMGGLLASFAASVLAHCRWDQPGAHGTAREAPVVEELTSTSAAPAESGSASAPTETTAEADADLDSSTDAEGAAAAPDGDSATAAADRDAKIEQLMIDHSHKQLVEKAKDLPGTNSKTPKATLAAALVDAGLAA